MRACLLSFVIILYGYGSGHGLFSADSESAWEGWELEVGLMGEPCHGKGTVP